MASDRLRDRAWGGCDVAILPQSKAFIAWPTLGHARVCVGLTTVHEKVRPQRVVDVTDTWGPPHVLRGGPGALVMLKVLEARERQGPACKWRQRRRISDMPDTIDSTLSS